MPRRAKTTKLFNGRRYTLRYRTSNRREASRLKRQLKSEGFLSRIVPMQRGTFWVWQGPKR